MATTTNKLPVVSNKTILAKGVSALADRPNIPGQYGQSGLSSASLKAWFDNLAKDLATAVQGISDAFNGTDAGTYIRMALNDYGGVNNLKDLENAFTSGLFAARILQVLPAENAEQKQALQTVLNTFAEKISVVIEQMPLVRNRTIAFGKTLDFIKNNVYHATDKPNPETINSLLPDSLNRPAEIGDKLTLIGTTADNPPVAISMSAEIVGFTEGKNGNAVFRANGYQVLYDPSDVKALQSDVDKLETEVGKKQDTLVFDGAYSENNKVATVGTVASEIAKLIAGAPTSFDTLKEIADWISKHPESVAALNASIETNAGNIETLTEKVTANEATLQKTLVLNMVPEFGKSWEEIKADYDANKEETDESKKDLIYKTDPIYSIWYTRFNKRPIVGDVFTSSGTSNDAYAFGFQARVVKVDGNTIRFAFDDIVGFSVSSGDILTNANNYTDGEVSKAVADINTESIEPLQTQVDIHDRSIATIQGEVVRVEGIAKGAQGGASYESYYDMVVALNGADKSLLNLYKSVYIGTENVPDLWVYAIADTPKQYTYTSEDDFANDLIKNKSVQVGYFIFKRLEFGKVDLENYYTKTETDDKLEEVKSASQVKIVRLI